MSERISNLKLLIERQEKCRATHIESVVVKERHDNRVIWEGVVESFQLEGHPVVKRAYAWVRPTSSDESLEPEYTIVLGLPPVNSAEDAVKVAVVNQIRELLQTAEQLAAGKKTPR